MLILTEMKIVLFTEYFFNNVRLDETLYLSSILSDCIYQKL